MSDDATISRVAADERVGKSVAVDGPVDPADAVDSGEATDAASGGLEVPLDALEAILFSTQHPLTAGRIAEVLDLPTSRPVRRAVAELNQQYEASARSFRIEQVAGGFQMLTLPEHGPLVRKLVQRDADARLSKPALETLAIIAYKQPILRVDVEGIRGVGCGETIRSLMEKHLVKIAGRADEPGRPILYGTTRRFLEIFGLNSLADLPKPDKPGQTPRLEPAELTA